jgi:hypothetical protein
MPMDAHDIRLDAVPTPRPGGDRVAREGLPTMTPTEVGLIKASWTAVEPIADTAAELF